MTAIDRAALIEHVAARLPDTWCGTAPDRMVAETLPVIARELLAPLRELHHDVVAYADFAMTTGRRECACGKSDCPTVRLLDQIEADVRGDHA